jgi:hypothetical protein
MFRRKVFQDDFLCLRETGHRGEELQQDEEQDNVLHSHSSFLLRTQWFVPINRANDTQPVLESDNNNDRTTGDNPSSSFSYSQLPHDMDPTPDSHSDTQLRKEPNLDFHLQQNLNTPIFTLTLLKLIKASTSRSSSSSSSSFSSSYSSSEIIWEGHG